MKQVRALSIDRHLKKILENSNSLLIVHSVFEHTVNILVENELYTLASRQIDNAPATMIIDLSDFSTCGIEANDYGSLSSMLIEIPNCLSIDLNTANTWKSELPSLPVNSGSLLRNIPIAMRSIIEKGKANWLRETEDKSSAFDKEMGHMLRKRTAELIENFQTGTKNENLHHGMQLVGLGQGLTPSGDDFLVGLLLAFSTTEKDYFSKKNWSEQVVRESKKNTNIISYSALRYAAIGQTRETVGLFIEALFNGKEVEVEKALSNVMRIGSSSGTEMAWGILNGLTLLLKQEEYNDNTSKN